MHCLRCLVCREASGVAARVRLRGVPSISCLASCAVDIAGTDGCGRDQPCLLAHVGLVKRIITRMNSELKSVVMDYTGMLLIKGLEACLRPRRWVARP